METLELMGLIPCLYIALRVFIRLWNQSLDSDYNDAQNRASCLLGEGQRDEARIVMDKALSDYKRFTVRKVLGYKVK